MEKQLDIVPFKPNMAKAFKELNLDWLEAFFSVEPHDLELLDHCEESIINKGGFIFFAKIGENVVGTFALLKIDSGIYELGKMAVDRSFRGQKIGQQLLAFCIRYAEKHHWKKLVLYSSTKLSDAIHIYEKYGFIEVPLEVGNPYLRSDIKMELNL